MVKKYFYYNYFRDLQKFLNKTNKNKELHKSQIYLIKDALKILKNDIKYISEGELKNKKLDLLAGLAKKLIDTNEQKVIKYIPELISEESSEQ